MTAKSTPSLMDQIYYVYHDETYMQINLTTQPRTPERNKVTDCGKKCTKGQFGCQIFWQNTTIAFSLLFGN